MTHELSDKASYGNDRVHALTWKRTSAYESTKRSLGHEKTEAPRLSARQRGMGDCSS